VQAFFGIRYGQAPIGDARFKSAVAAAPWTEAVYDATQARHSAIQPPPVEFLASRSQRMNTNPTYDEDCLFLNVYTPAADNQKRPVLYWIHGGSYVTGSGYEYDGRVLAEQGDVVVVTINYRLGLLGFIDLSEFGGDYIGSASNGIRDQILGLQWVRDNIADYGGDAGNVTLFGESAGAGSVNALLAAPSADGLYHRAIAHSGSIIATPPPPMVPGLAAHLSVSTADLPDKLASMSAQDILALQTATSIVGGACVDGTVVTRSTSQAIADRGTAGVPYIAGSNLNEGTLFTHVMPAAEEVYEQYSGLLATMMLEGADSGDYMAALKSLYPQADAKTLYEYVWTDLLRRPSIELAAAATAAGPGGWLYRFDVPTNVDGANLGATHASEIAFTFNTFADPKAAGVVMHDREDPALQKLAQQWSTTAMNFARTGDPNGGGLPAWVPYENSSRQSLVLDVESWCADAELDIEHRKLWGEA
jgi:para-nitrobenzyl esterase